MDYSKYSFSKYEKLGLSLVGFIGSFFVLYLFYENVIAAFILAFPGCAIYMFYMKSSYVEKQKEKLSMEFKDAMESLISALSAGYSMENAVSEAHEDLLLMYGKSTPMIRELKDMEQKISLQIPLDKVFMDFGKRSGVEQIVTFAQIYATARKSGGNLIKVMKRTTDNIGEKIEVNKEIQTMISGKKMESTIMMIIPIFIIVYMKLFNQGFLDPLYSSLGGRIFMTVCLVVYVLAIWMSRKIVNIKA